MPERFLHMSPEDLEREAGRTYDDNFSWLGFALLFLAVVSVVVKGTKYVAEHLSDWLLSHSWVHPICVGGVIVGSVALYLVRHYFRRVYAMGEIATGCGVAWVYTTNPIGKDGFGVAGMMGAAYLLIRGFDNWQTGSEPHRRIEQPAEAVSASTAH